MKYLKNFNTETEYLSFKEGPDYVTPNVSYIEETLSVSFAPKLKVISTCTINNDVTVTFVEGMTWEEYINSEYNPKSVSFGHVSADSNNSLEVTGLVAGKILYNSKYVKISDKVIANIDYGYGITFG